MEIEPTLHAWNEAYLIMVNAYFDVFLDSFCEHFIFRIDIQKQNWSEIICWVFV